MRVRGGKEVVGHGSSLDGPWGSTSTCSSTCTSFEAPITLQPTWAPQAPPSHSPWSLALDPPQIWSPGAIPPSSLPSASQRTDLVRGARGRRPSVVANLLRDAPQGTRGEVDIRAFHRYYEGSTLGGEYPLPTSPRGRERSICGSNGALGGTLASLGVVLPTKLEALLKLLAQSLHLVLQALCSRKARRKDRECSSAHEHKLYLEEAVLERNIPETDLRQLVDLPPGLGYEEWLASHTIDFFHHINLLYGTVCEFCTLTGCPDMTGPGLRQYLWFDEKGKKTRVAAPQYVDYVMTFTQNTVNDESIFPTKFENDFPSSFESIVKKIHRLLFHVVAHLYHAHFREVVLLSLHSHLNCVFAHFVLFNEKFKLVDDKETEILHDLVMALKIHPDAEGHSHPLDRQELPLNDDMSGEAETGSLCIPRTAIPDSSSGSPSAISEGGGCFSHLGEGVDDDLSVSPLRSNTDPLYEREEPSTSVTATVTQVSTSIPPLAGGFVNNVTLADVLP